MAEKAFNFLDAFYRAEHNQAGLLNDLGGVLASESTAVRLVPFGCETESVEWFDHRARGQRHATLLRRQDRLYEFRLDYTFTDAGEERSKSGRFFVLQHPDFPKVFVALTVEPSDFFDRALMPFLRGSYPKLLLTFIPHKRLRRLIDDFKTGGGYQDIVITRASQRLRYNESSNQMHAMPVVRWPQMSLDQAFDWVGQNNGWFQSIEFAVKDSDRTAAKISVTRQGVVRANGLLQRAYTVFTEAACKTIHENITLFSHRSRLARPDLSTSPLVIEFEGDQFSEVEENTRLIQAMRKLRTASVSVLHGNPYLHLSLLDYFDGSAFDLWVLDERRIILVPQFKASVAAIKRLVNHIYDDYAEGNLSSYQEAGQ
jgi:hypothetical protein